MRIVRTGDSDPNVFAPLALLLSAAFRVQGGCAPQ